MKMFAVVMLSVFTIPSYAQGILGTLKTYQDAIQPKPNTKTDGTDATVKVDPVEKTKTSGACTEKIQTSLPLAYITALIMEKNGKLEIQHDSRNGKLSVKSGDMIGNCSSMVEWVPNVRVVDEKKIYSIEAKIKEGADCADGTCTYDVAKVEKGQFKDFEKVKIAPTMQGFESCLEKSGVIKDGKVIADAIYPSAVSEKFDGYKESGELLFVSHGPSSKLIKPKYDANFVEIDQCDHYEKITAEGITIKSLAQEENERIQIEKDKVSTCGDYEQIADFIERYQGYSDDLNGIRDNLIIEAVKKASKAIIDGKYTEDDLKTIADFEKYVVQPKINLANILYTEAEGLEGEDKKVRIDEMKKVLAELATFNNTPFISAAVVTKLEGDGRFSEAAQANGIKAIIVSHSRLGAKEGGVLITPDVAKSRADNFKQAYVVELEGKKEKFDIRTGQITGQAQTYSQLATRMRQNIQTRSQNFSQEIQEEYARTQPGGYCYKNPFRNVQRCIQNSMERVSELQAQMQHFNQVDAQRAAEFDAKAVEYAKLEKEGRAYVANQNGETVDESNTQVDNTVPGRRNEEGYAFNFQGTNQQQGQNGQQQNGNQYQQQNPYGQQQQYQQNTNSYGQQNMFSQQNPYGQQQQYNNPYQQQQNYMGQQNYGGQFNVGANFGANMGGQQSPYGNYQQQGYGQQQQYGNPYQQQGYGQQQQQYGNPYQQQGYGQQQQGQGYWSSPYQAYGNYNMYGR